ncbi:hypothetical protein ACFX1Z_011089 [Malus domestica]
MVTAAQLQILQSPIISLISSVSNSVHMKLDDTNYLAWHFQMQLLLEGHSIIGFVDGSTPCPAQFASESSADSTVLCGDSSTRVVTDEYKIWKMHDKALMQLITATLSPAAISCAIGSTSSKDLWFRLKDQFSTVTKASIFQLKSELQTIKKGNDSITLYLQKIKEARDLLTAAGVIFEDDDVVILTLNGLPAEYNTIRSVIRGRETVISLKDLRSQLLAEEALLESVSALPVLSALMAQNTGFPSKHQSFSSSGANYSSPNSNAYKSFNNNNKGRNRFNSNFTPKFGNNKVFHSSPAPGFLGTSPPRVQNYGVQPQSCQICGKNNHVASTCWFRNSNTSSGCQICGKNNHLADTCRYRNVIVPSGCQICGNPYHSAEMCFQKNSTTPMNAMHAATHNGQFSPLSMPSTPVQSQVWLTDSGANNHMTSELSNLSLATPYPANEDKATGMTLYKGLCNNGLYPIISPRSLPVNNKGQPSPPMNSAPLPSLISPHVPIPDHNNVLVLPTNPCSSIPGLSPGCTHLRSDATLCPMSLPNVHQSSAELNAIPVAVPSSTSEGSSSDQSIGAAHTQSLSSTLPVVPEFQSENLQVVLSIPSLNLHPMQTRSKSGISKAIALLAAVHEHEGVDLSQVEPATYKSALKSPVWYEAMQDEISALHKQGTWSLVPLPKHKNLVGCKWVFKIKKNADGSIGRYKARLVAKGFNQEEGIDYGETFSPVVKPTTVRLVLALSAHFGWSLRQLDVKNAFLHGILQEEVYMTQPPGFGDSKHEDYVCRLHKSLYGLKQAPRAWNERFTSFLPSLGFTSTYADSSLFVKTVDTSVVILLLYVDDIIITRSATHAIHAMIQSLTQEFDIKDLGPLHYFLGIQIVHKEDGLFLSQDKYVTDLLTKSEMLLSKPCATPCFPYNRLLKDDGKPFNNPALYRSLVGALQYLTFTRPDISFAVHQVYQFMQCPMESHFVAVKRILRYLRATQGCGIHYIKGSLEITAYSDADWAGDPNDRRSTTGLVVFLGSNPISWSSKKQHTVSRSSTEAEYRALSTTAAELDWIKQLLVFLHVPISVQPVLFCDNLSAIALTCNPVQHQRTKHIEIDVHFVRERVARHDLQVHFVSSNEQFADILTKGLSAPLFQTHCANLRLCFTAPELVGGC